MGRRLTISLDVCRDCAECVAACTYPYHPSNRGIARLRELAAQELTCRKCDLQSCVVACPYEALERRQDGILHRYNMRCTACLSCSYACPFGNLIPAALEFRDSMCDFCAGRGHEVPACVPTCPYSAIALEEPVADAPNVYLLGEHVAVRATLWHKVEPAQTK
jgi:Fe-S-cluster-containing hydrogenase component 2